jgi:hypothetical protein
VASYPVAIPQCFVDIYTYEGNTYSLQGAQVRAVVVTKSIDPQADTGTFALTLAPGGPNGANQIPSWSDVITPMSLVVIGMRRGTNAAITMLGVVRAVGENQEWPVDRPGAPVDRQILITGFDFSYFYTMFTYYSLWYLGATGVGVSAQTPSEGLPTQLGASYLIGDPGQIAAAWFEGIMAGSIGVLSRSFVPFQGGKIFFGTAMARVIETYDVMVPYGEYFVGTEGSWIDKYRLMLPFPFYEFFVTTSPTTGGTTSYEDPEGVNYADNSSGYAFTSKGLGSSITASPVMVARRNPVPALTAQIENGVANFNGIDATAWRKLTVNQLDLGGFVSSQVSFDESQVHNLYVINPTFGTALNGGSNSSIIPYVMTAGGAGDAASIHRYGLRPASIETHWQCDPTGQFAQLNESSPVNNFILGATLLARYASYWHPTPLMAKATVTTWLRPDILPGTIFRYSPFKGDVTWDFYVTGVTHRWVFGGPSVTQLTLERGLPTSVYADNNLLYNIHLGNATRVGSTYTVGLPYDSSPTLQAIALGNFQDFLSNIASVYSKPQAP